ncbi:transporter, major facilitator family protein [Aeromicrobium marinum DSM 15272]|uniref:Transporter, major facilitator family protein n=1 Tax=Aeromicrobium marinum DSM 15272 TaxID=585531 RepID=E2SDF8_9ACTN|nr:MDR family MFS transporter [Aeromicrobium marinum]EFQ82535.1 transporter, major facilitator family protein [Aeromicrobium marinum DSM 15272]
MQLDDEVTDPPAETVAQPRPEYTHREVLEVLVGLLAAMFTGLISSTIVSNAVPTIIADLDGSQTQYTWVITASLLAMTVSTPVWGKLSDLFDKKLMIQTAIGIFVVGSVLAGLSRNLPELIAMRAVQGIGMGGIIATGQALIAAIIPPRQRGRYAGYLGATMAVATVSGPLIGGIIVDTPGLGWRWCFFVCVPLAVMSLVVLQRFLRLPDTRRSVDLDYAGALLIAVAASLPLVWVTFAGDAYPWVSWTSAAFLGGTALAAGLVVVVESRHAEPVLPLQVVRQRTTTLAIIGSIAVGISMFGGSVFLGQYFQVAGGHSPTVAGLLGTPLMVGSLVGTVVSGRLITRYGRWKRFLVTGSALLVVGFGLLATVDHTTPEWHTMVFMAVVGLGMGMMLQNFVLAVQNTVDVREVGSASASVAFFRSLGGAVGVAVLGAILAAQVRTDVTDGLGRLGLSRSGDSGSLLDVGSLPGPVAEVVRAAYGDATGNIFAVAAVVSVISLVAAVMIKEIPLRTTVAMQEPDGPAVPVAD